ncbi:MAG: acetate--CoA ligase family protein [Nanoarchaeota archaeon]|nr:acetate--CoA ligase family protein [Nanoarchaeota archaeon]
MLNLKESFEFLRVLPLAKWKIFDGDFKCFGFPYYLKANISGHKTEDEGVFRCDNINEAKNYFKILSKKFPEIIIQESFEGIEMIAGVKEDKVFGKLLMVGFGGIFAEIKRDVVFRSIPVSRNDVVSMVKELSGFGIFNSRGKKYNLEKFYTLIEKVSYVGEKFNVKELDLNPVMVGENAVRIVDARVGLDRQ